MAKRNESNGDDFGLNFEAQLWAVDDERDQCIASNVFWLPLEARWQTINPKAKSLGTGKVIDNAMGVIDRENPTLKGVLPLHYTRPSLDKVRIGGLRLSGRTSLTCRSR